MRTAGRLGQIVNDESGQILVLGALCMALLMAVMAVAVDVGYMHYKQIQLQTAADAAAIAAGLEIGNCSSTGGVVCSNMEKAAEQALIEDGITTATITPTTNQCTVPTSSGLAMIINVAPCVQGSSDPNYGNAYMAEVVLTEPQSTFFGKLFGINIFNLTARAEAGEAYYLDNGGGNCLYTHAITVNSNATIDLKNCGIYDGGNVIANSGDSITASAFVYTGTFINNSGNTWNIGSPNTLPTRTNTTQNDPLASLTPPSKPSTSYTGNTVFNSGSVNLTPGYYSSGIIANSGVTINLSPGLYYFNSSLIMNSGDTLECTTCTGGQGVTLYFNSGGLIANSTVDIKLTAPATGSTANGDVANMLLWASSTNSTGMIINSDTSSYYNGTIYLPDGQLTMNSNSTYAINGSSVATALDVNSIIFNANINFDINGSGGYLGGVGKVLGLFALAE